MISNRIKLIASLIDNNETVCDIGCDHGYLALALRNNGNTAHIVLSDEKEGPLNSARENMNTYGIENVELVISDGLINVDYPCDCYVCAGMGFNTVEHIILNSKEKFDKAKKIIIQVNTDSDKMRLWLNENGYKIIDERIIEEYKYYTVIVACKGIQRLSERAYLYGPCLLEKRDKTFIDYLNFLYEKNQAILKRLSKDHKDYLRFEEKLKEIEEILNNKDC